MRSVEDAHLVEQDDCDAATFALADLSSETAQKCFDVLPGNVRAGWVRKECFQCLLMGTLHAPMVPEAGTERNARRFLVPNVRAKRATTAGRQARAGENVPRTARPGLVACRWRSA